VLQVISSSPGDLQLVFETMLAEAVRICDAKFGNIFRRESEGMHLVARHNTPPAFAEFRRRSPHTRLIPETFLGRMSATKAVVHVADIAADQGYIEQRVPEIVAAVELGGIRTLLAVPMLNEKELIGAFTLLRQEVRPFTDKQIALVQNFATQAVIAIENARLLNELRRRTDDLTQRTADLTEALEQQTATSEVLQVISSSPSDLQPVFATMLEKAVRICDAKFGTMYLCVEGKLRLIAAHNVPIEFEDARGDRPFTPAPDGIFDKVLKTGTTVHLPDLAATKPYAERHPGVVEAVELGGIRTVVAVPMFKENELIGIVNIHRREVRPFTDKQIALLTNFASQAVIAIENARLLTELRQRTADLTESLEQQTATSEVLQVISSSPGDLQPVFAAMLENAARICDANFGNIFRWDGDALHLIATHNTPPPFAEYRERRPLPLKPSLPFARMVSAKAVVHCADAAALPAYVEHHDPEVVAAVELGGIRTFVAVPMLKENELIGALIVYRQEVRPFTDRQIELVKNFAAQAVIAIENARLLGELRESLQEQTATSEVLQIISSSPGDLQPVFATMLEKAARICEANFGDIFRWEGEALQLVAALNTPRAFFELRKRTPLRPNPENPVGRMLATKVVVHVTDLAAEHRYEKRDPNIVAAVELGGVRTFVALPMLRENELIGAFILYRQEVRPFTDKQIALLTNFAAQAVIAIENARLLNELRESLEQQTANRRRAKGH
jgi:GAF domain-containing protein